MPKKMLSTGQTGHCARRGSALHSRHRSWCRAGDRWSSEATPGRGTWTQRHRRGLLCQVGQEPQRVSPRRNLRHGSPIEPTGLSRVRRTRSPAPAPGTERGVGEVDQVVVQIPRGSLGGVRVASEDGSQDGHMEVRTRLDLGVHVSDVGEPEPARQAPQRRDLFVLAWFVASAATASTIVESSAITSVVMTFIERPGMSQVATAMPSGSVSKRKFV